jgi:hypothetical protein
MLVKILGAIDILAAFIFLLLAFGSHPAVQLILFCAGLLFAKGLFILTGDIISIVDIFSFGVLILSIFFAIPVILYWIPSFLLLGKGFLSFL